MNILPIQFLNFVCSGDFTVSFHDIENEEESVFSLLIAACQNLADISFKLHKFVSTQNPIQKRRLYSESCYKRMMWSKWLFM